MKQTRYAILTFCFLSFALVLQSNAQPRKMPKIGVATSLDNDSLLKANGFDYIEEGARKLFAPTIPDTTYRRYQARLRGMKLKVTSCNLFLPANIRLTGPEANEDSILSYVNTVMKRARETGVRIVVFGSAGARKLQEGQDSATAMRELIDISRKMAAVAALYGRTIAMENLNKSEDNFINSLSIATSVVKAVNHPNFRLTVDLYHMKREGEQPEDIAAAAPYLVHCHIAEKEGRRAPGTSGEDFRPYFAALKKAGYKGNITIECGWKDMPNECAPALQYLRRQLEESYL
ncbi:sugar phosphate isomerase/epimerase family protein [Chitinophaga lutea]